MTPSIRLVLGLSAFAACLGSGPAAAAPHDGAWSVLIVTQKGNCDTYRYSVNIQNGTVKLAEDAPVNLVGTVASSGAIKVSVSRGTQRADGTGRLSGSKGSGSWKGTAQNSQCSGRWEAEKR
jgi:hypothetical protein